MEISGVFTNKGAGPALAGEKANDVLGNTFTSCVGHFLRRHGYCERG